MAKAIKSAGGKLGGVLRSFVNFVIASGPQYHQPTRMPASGIVVPYSFTR